MSKIRVTMVMEYDVPDDHKDRVASYDTADLVEMAKVDESNAILDPTSFVSAFSVHDVKVTVEPVE